MTIEQLDQYAKLRARWNVLNRKISESREEKIDCVVDIVEGSNKSFPFQRVHFSVAGLDPEQLQRTSMQIRGWESEIDEIESDLMQIETYISEASDPVVKTAMELYYLTAMTWPVVSKKIYGDASKGNTIRMAVQRYVEKYPENSPKE